MISLMEMTIAVWCLLMRRLTLPLGIYFSITTGALRFCCISTSYRYYCLTWVICVINSLVLKLQNCVSVPFCCFYPKSKTRQVIPVRESCLYCMWVPVCVCAKVPGLIRTWAHWWDYLNEPCYYKYPLCVLTLSLSHTHTQHYLCQGLRGKGLWTLPTNSGQ